MDTIEWQLTRVGSKWAMAKAESKGIDVRNLNLLERIRYYFRMRRHDILYPNWKGKK